VKTFVVKIAGRDPNGKQIPTTARLRRNQEPTDTFEVVADDAADAERQFHSMARPYGINVDVVSAVEAG
jgi:hypothetical protein